MTPEQFCYWLQGFIELQDADHRERSAGLTEEQRTMIRDHLDLVFTKVTPDRSTKKKVITEEKKPEGSKDARKKFQELIDEAAKKTGPKVNPFDRPDVYCSPSSGLVRIC